MLQRTGILLVVSGPSGSGKTTVCRSASAVTPLYYTVSCTTRAMRPGEVHGRDYFFLTDEEFQRRIQAGDFLEHAQVHGRCYGTLKSEVLPRLAAGEDVIMDLDPQGAAQLRACGDAAIRHSLVDVYIMPAGMEELRARLTGRQSESEAELQLRLLNALDEMRHWAEYTYTIVSRTKEEDLGEFLAVITAERRRSSRLLLPALPRRP
ncbi:MAG: guanylate kinase [Verrucomicrobiaceae bacterium]|nr:MAG: guanylate kinase [Verrucomicrobiaceae bacterium]